MAKSVRLFLVCLLNVMLLLTPIVAQANNGEAGCLPRSMASGQVAELGHGHDTGHVSEQYSEDEISHDRVANMATCCTQGCLIDLSLSMPEMVAIPVTIKVPAAWILANLSDLTGPSGLRRPPRA